MIIHFYIKHIVKNRFGDNTEMVELLTINKDITDRFEQTWIRHREHGEKYRLGGREVLILINI